MVLHDKLEKRFDQMKEAVDELKHEQARQHDALTQHVTAQLKELDMRLNELDDKCDTHFNKLSKQRAMQHNALMQHTTAQHMALMQHVTAHAQRLTQSTVPLFTAIDFTSFQLPAPQDASGVLNDDGAGAKVGAINKYLFFPSLHISHCPDA